jgi:GR25 family glycosyltransferase involved in LPS biosynthesis
MKCTRYLNLVKFNTEIKLPPIYIVNLERFPEKYRNTKKNILETGILNGFERYNAYDGLKMLPYGKDIQSSKTKEEIYKYTDLMYNELKKQGLYNSELYLKPGEIGHYFSFYNIFKEALKNNYESIIILEDDIYFTNPKNFLQQYIELINNVPDDWDLLYFGMTDAYFNIGKGMNKKINKYICEPSGSTREGNYKGMINGNHATMYKKTAIKYFVENMLPMYYPTDAYMGKICTIEKKLKCYSSCSPIIKAEHCISTTSTYKLEGTNRNIKKNKKN